jgi:hypothetical protein
MNLKKLKEKDFLKALNINAEEVKKIRQLSAKQVEVIWIDGMKQKFLLNKPTSLVK